METIICVGKVEDKSYQNVYKHVHKICYCIYFIYIYPLLLWVFFKFVFRHCAKLNYFLRVAIVATGIWKPRIPDIPGHELMDGYEDLSMNASDYEGKSVMILGNY